MTQDNQYKIFDSQSVDLLEEKTDIREWGTFKDSLKAPVHGWFTYPAGFSYKAVEHSLKNANLTKGVSTVYDPFMGSGTTNIASRVMGYNSVGVEAHPFVYPITKSKMQWDIDSNSVYKHLEDIDSIIRQRPTLDNLEGFLKNAFPELILKCFLPETLYELLIIRDSINSAEMEEDVRNFLNTGLICVLRDVSTASTGWPYIAPDKPKITSMSKKGWETYRKRVIKMLSDLTEIKKQASSLHTDHRVLYGDSRSTINQIDSNSVDHIFTSPPYLNNFDYADRTRLEMYFMGAAKNWGEISDKVRTKLMTSATTQISRNDVKYTFLESFKQECPNEYAFLSEAVESLSKMRLIKGGKKSYDLMTVGYFNDMYQILKDNFRVLRPGSKALYVLGDSAPYGVHIPTDELIGQIGTAIGFSHYTIDILRVRGNKWQNNPQRHGVLLQESVITLYK